MGHQYLYNYPQECQLDIESTSFGDLPSLRPNDPFWVQSTTPPNHQRQNTFVNK